MHAITETAYAKVNLTLRVLGRRADGMHELHSIVAFADIGDGLQVTQRSAGATPRGATLTVSGPFAREITGENLVERAIRAVEVASGVPFDAEVVLDKRLPVASGIGGGSADAAAMLRAMRRAGGAAFSNVDWEGIARRLGADVPVCLASRPALMTGIGEKLTPLDLPRLAVVLVNARQPVPADKTRQVFRALAAASLEPGSTAKPTPEMTFDRTALLDAMRRDGNELERAAMAVLPSIAALKPAVAATAGCEIAVLSGAGPTIVGVYVSHDAAATAAETLTRDHPGWWIAAATTLGA